MNILPFQPPSSPELHVTLNNCIFFFCTLKTPPDQTRQHATALRRQVPYPVWISCSRHSLVFSKSGFQNHMFGLTIPVVRTVTIDRRTNSNDSWGLMQRVALRCCSVGAKCQPVVVFLCFLFTYTAAKWNMHKKDSLQRMTNRIIMINRWKCCKKDFVLLFPPKVVISCKSSQP